MKCFVIPPSSKIGGKRRKNRLLDASWLTNLPRFKGARPDHLRVESSSFSARSIGPKCLEIPVQIRMEQKVFGNLLRKFQLSCFLEIWKFRKFPVPLGISTRYDLGLNSPSPELCFDQCYRRRLAGTSLGAKWSAEVRVYFWLPILHKNVKSWFSRKWWTGRSEFLVDHFVRFLYSPSRVVRKFLSSHEMMFGSVRYLSRKSLLQIILTLKTATSSQSCSMLSSNSWRKMCSSGNRTRSVQPGGKYRSIRHTKISEI